MTGKHTSGSPIGTPGDIGRGGAQRGSPRIQDGSHRLKLTDEWKRRGGVTIKLTERSPSAQGAKVSGAERR